MVCGQCRTVGVSSEWNSCKNTSQQKTCVVKTCSYKIRILLYSFQLVRVILFFYDIAVFALIAYLKTELMIRWLRMSPRLWYPFNHSISANELSSENKIILSLSQIFINAHLLRLSASDPFMRRGDPTRDVMLRIVFIWGWPIIVHHGSSRTNCIFHTTPHTHCIVNYIIYLQPFDMIHSFRFRNFYIIVNLYTYHLGRS